MSFFYNNSKNKTKNWPQLVVSIDAIDLDAAGTKLTYFPIHSRKHVFRQEIGSVQGKGNIDFKIPALLIICTLK